MEGRNLALALVAAASAPLLLLRAWPFNLIIFVTPILATYFLVNNFERVVRVPALQVASILLLLSTIVVLVNSSPSISLVGSLFVITLSGIALGYELGGDKLSDVLAISSIFGVGITALSIILASFVSGSFMYVVHLVSLASSLYVLVRVKGKRVEVKLDSYFALFLTILAFYLAELVAVSHVYFRQTMNDIVRHMFYSRILVQDPSKYFYVYYLGYHSLLGALIQFTEGFPLAIALSSSVFSFLSAFLIYSSLSKFEEKKAALFVWGLLSGLVWILVPVFGTSYEGLAKLSLAGYYGLTWSHPLFFWGMPQVLVLGLMMVLLTMPNRGFKVNFTISTVIMTLTALMHLPEGVMLAGLIAIRPLIKRDELNKPLSLAALASGVITLLAYHLVVRRLPFTTFLSVLSISVGGLLGIALEFLSNRVRLHIPRRLPVKHLVLSAYLSGIVVWLLNFDKVNVKALFDIGYVPWFYYPVLLGILGILVILSEGWRKYPEFVLLAIIAVIAGKVASLIKLSGSYLPYWEYRVIPVVALALALPASAYVMRALSSLDRRKASFILVAVIVLGYPTLALSFQRWYDVSHSDKYEPLTVDSDDVMFLHGKNLSRTLSFAYKSAMAVALNTAHVVRSAAPWYSDGPELANYFMNQFGVKEVFFSRTDVKLVKDENLSSYLYMTYNQRKNAPLLVRVNPSKVTLNSTLAVVFPADTYYYRRAIVLYSLISDKLPPHVTYLSYDPDAPSGIYIGPSSNVTLVNESLPKTPWDLRWLLLLGNFSEGLSVKGGRNMAISTYELDQGTFTVNFCPTVPEGSVALIYRFKNLKNYNVVRYRFEGILQVAKVSGGKVKMLGMSRAPPTEGCVNMTIATTAGDKNVLIVNGAKYPLKGGELGLLGIETEGFIGEISGRAFGNHTLTWNPPPDALLIDVDGPLKPLIDSALAGKTSTRNISLQLPRSQALPSKTPNYVALRMVIQGSIKLSGRLIKYIDLKGNEEFVGKIVSIKPDKVYLLGGKGFYVYLGIEGPNSGTYVFRTPVSLSFSGNGSIYGHRFQRLFVERLRRVDMSEGNITILMADKAALLRIQVKKVLRGVELPINEAFYALEGIILTIAIFLILRKYLG